MRFNPPPNWPPSPPGWTPPPGWQPDPSWPPPPPGWQLWVAEGPSRSKNGLIIGGLVAALVVVVGVVITVVVLKSPSGGTATPTTTASKTAEQQIEDAIEQFQNAWNDRNFDGFKPILCEEMKNDEEFNETDFLDARDESGELKLEVESVDIDGDTATASVTNAGENADEIDFVREDGSWKWCKP